MGNQPSYGLRVLPATNAGPNFITHRKDQHPNEYKVEPSPGYYWSCLAWHQASYWFQTCRIHLTLWQAKRKHEIYIPRFTIWPVYPIATQSRVSYLDHSSSEMNWTRRLHGWVQPKSYIFCRGIRSRCKRSRDTTQQLIACLFDEWIWDICTTNTVHKDNAQVNTSERKGLACK